MTRLHTAISDVPHREIRLMLSPVEDALTRAGVQVTMLPPQVLTPDQLARNMKPTDEFLLVFPDGQAIRGDATFHAHDGGDTTWHLYVAETPGSDQLRLLGQVQRFPYEDEPNSTPELLADHALLERIGLSRIVAAQAGHVTLSGDRTVPRLTGERGSPLAGSDVRTSWDDRTWLTAGQVAQLHALPGWTPRDWDGNVLSAEVKAEMYTHGDEIVLHGQRLAGRAAEQVGRLFGTA